MKFIFLVCILKVSCTNKLYEEEDKCLVKNDKVQKSNYDKEYIRLLVDGIWDIIVNDSRFERFYNSGNSSTFKQIFDHDAENTKEAVYKRIMKLLDKSYNEVISNSFGFYEPFIDNVAKEMHEVVDILYLCGYYDIYNSDTGKIQFNEIDKEDIRKNLLFFRKKKLGAPPSILLKQCLDSEFLKDMSCEKRFDTVNTINPERKIRNISDKPRTVEDFKKAWRTLITKFIQDKNSTQENEVVSNKIGIFHHFDVPIGNESHVKVFRDEVDRIQETSSHDFELYPKTNKISNETDPDIFSTTEHDIDFTKSNDTEYPEKTLFKEVYNKNISFLDATAANNFNLSSTNRSITDESTVSKTNPVWYLVIILVIFIMALSIFVFIGSLISKKNEEEKNIEMVELDKNSKKVMPKENDSLIEDNQDVKIENEKRALSRND